jgi:hypothetical protein
VAPAAAPTDISALCLPGVTAPINTHAISNVTMPIFLRHGLKNSPIAKASPQRTDNPPPQSVRHSDVNWKRSRKTFTRPNSEGLFQMAKKRLADQ